MSVPEELSRKERHLSKSGLISVPATREDKPIDFEIMPLL